MFRSFTSCYSTYHFDGTATVYTIPEWERKAFHGMYDENVLPNV